MQHAKVTGIFFGLTVMLLAVYSHAASVVTISYEASKNDKVLNQINTMTIDGEKLRVDYLGVEQKKTRNTPFLLTLDNGNTWVIGNQDKEEYYCADLTMTEFFTTVGDLVTKIDSYTNAEYSDTRVEKVLEENGPQLLGHPTVHVRIQSSATVKASVFILSYEFQIKKVDDFWYASDMQPLPARTHWIEALTHSGHAHLDKLSQQIRGSIKGALLKQETVMEVFNVKKDKTDKYGRKIAISSVTEVKESELAADTFRKPDCEAITDSQVKSTVKTMFKEGKLTL